MSQKIMLLGDTHGDKKAYLEALEFCIEHKIKHVFLLGDCGLFPGFIDTQDYIDAVNKVSRANDIQNWWVRGNHDDPYAWQATIDHWPGQHGSGKLRTHINLLPRARVFNKFNLNFLVVGGAVSVDREWRKAHNAKHPKKLVWWPDEIISPEDVISAKAQALGKNIDILVTHECSDHTPWQRRLKPDLHSEGNRKRLDEIIKVARPDFHFHGHMHERYEWENYLIHQGNYSTMTYGLECNSRAMWHGAGYTNDNWLTFDLDSKQVKWKYDYSKDMGE